ncbi:MAG: hypothetical protein MIO88_01295 [Methanoregulaceae archaeon]|nr:hypothetical protein [Methanoregulaceae archaeon]
MDADADQGFDITPSYGYQITDVIVDGRSKGALTRYTFFKVQSDHQIHATFLGNSRPCRHRTGGSFPVLCMTSRERPDIAIMSNE